MAVRGDAVKAVRGLMASVGSLATFALAYSTAEIVKDGYGVAPAHEFLLGCLLVFALLVLAATGAVSVFPDEDA